jgi:CTD small phosphatase-like protein 2
MMTSTTEMTSDFESTTARNDSLPNMQMDLSDLESEDARDSFDLVYRVQQLYTHHYVNKAPFKNQVLPNPPANPDRITLVLDLDETLVHCSTDATKCPHYDLDFKVEFQNRMFRVFVQKRPGVLEFLERVSKLFEVVIFTASQQIYADALLDLLDPVRQFTRYRLFRDSCVRVEDTFVKDLRILGRDMSRVVIVDNAVEAFSFQVENGIPIKSFFDDPEDNELSKLYSLLVPLADDKDVRPALKRQFQLEKRIQPEVVKPNEPLFYFPDF